jgi:hypothetical protein
MEDTTLDEPLAQESESELYHNWARNLAADWLSPTSLRFSFTSVLCEADAKAVKTGGAEITTHDSWVNVSSILMDDEVVLPMPYSNGVIIVVEMLSRRSRLL